MKYAVETGSLDMIYTKFHKDLSKHSKVDMGRHTESIKIAYGKHTVDK
jgi:hypothetical protein